VRRGWYALPGVPEDAIRAARVGGRLACVSALAHHNGGVTAADQPLHVAVVRASSRLRFYDAEVVVLHWSRQRLPGTRLAVSEEVARAQTARCRGLG
jgi:hypothetical protein